MAKTKAVPKDKSKKRVRTYDESNIKVVKGLAVVRARPGMYMGDRGDNMVFQMFKEPVDNSMDEALADRNDLIEVYIDTKKNEFIVADNGNGIPVGMNKQEKISTLTVVFTQLHAGGKFDDDAYANSIGTHGVGVAATNALSKQLKVWTKRDGVWYSQEFAKGIPQTKVVKEKPTEPLKFLSGKKYGSIVKFIPDQTIVSEDAKEKTKDKKRATLDVKRVLPWLKNLAMLNPGLKIIINLPGGKTYKFLNSKGLDQIVINMVGKNEWTPLTRKPLSISTDSVHCVLQWCTHDSTEYFKSYVNCSHTKEHGRHYTGLRNAISKALTDVMKEQDEEKPKKEKKVKVKTKTRTRKPRSTSGAWSISDIVVGMVGFLDYRMHEPEFSSQTKEKLTSKVEDKVEEVLYKELLEYFRKNKALPKQLVKRAQAVSKGREELKKVVQSVTNLKKGVSGKALPVELYASKRSTPAHKRELYIVEGDSAGGTAKFARDPIYQEVFKLSGKPSNAMRTELPALLANQKIHALLVSLGIDVKSLDTNAETMEMMKFSVDKLRVGKIMLLADGDSDGGHITVLLLSLIWRLIPDMYHQGRVFVVDCPLYSAQYNNKHYYGANFKEVDAQLPKGASRSIITRAKGLGELNADVLQAIAFDVKARTLVKVSPPATPDAHDYFMSIVGDNTSTRKKLLGLKE